MAELDALTGIYALAMDAPASELPGRKSIMERHATYPAFCAVVAVLPREPGEPGRPGGPGNPGGPGRPDGPGRLGGPGRPDGPDNPGGPGRPGGPDHGHHRDEAEPGGRASPRELIAMAEERALIGFAYGFHGSTGQWWHDVVRENLTAHHDRETAGHWLGDSFEFAEVHVRPGHQGRGTGRAMMHTLAAGRPERTAVLSTPDGQTRARRLYRSLGFADLLPAFTFPGAGPSYAIMGAELPLRDEPAAAGRPASPSRW
jgi:GNAT superfamily N-acetyltransferase